MSKSKLPNPLGFKSLNDFTKACIDQADTPDFAANRLHSFKSFEAACVTHAEERAKAAWKESAKQRRLLGLHAELGYKSFASFMSDMKAVHSFLEKKRKEKNPPKRKKPVRVTEELRTRARHLKAGGLSGPQIADALGVSHATALLMLDPKQPLAPRAKPKRQ